VQDVYADLLFLVNFSMDYLCLWLTARLQSRRVVPWRMLLGAALGGVYAVVALFIDVSTVFSYVLDAAACVVLCAVGLRLKRESRKSFLRVCATFFGFSLLLGGMMTALYALLGRYDHLLEGVQEEGLSAWLFLLLSFLCTALSAIWEKRIRATLGVRKVTLRLTEGEKSIVLTGIRDTGNLLRDPLSGKAVVPVDLQALASFLPSPLIEAVNRQDAAQALAALPVEFANRTRVVPANTALGSGLLFCIKPQAAYLVGKQGEKPMDVWLAPLPLNRAKVKSAKCVHTAQEPIQLLLPGDIAIDG